MNDRSVDEEHDEGREGRVPGLDRLSLDREPGRDLWPGIESRIRPAKVAVPRPRRRSWLPLAAAASLTAALAGLLGLQLAQRPASTPAIPVASTEPARNDPAPQQLAVADGKHSLRKENRALVKANLKMVVSAEQELQQALLVDPNSPYLQNLLQATDSQQQRLRGLLARKLT